MLSILIASKLTPTETLDSETVSYCTVIVIICIVMSFSSQIQAEVFILLCQQQL